MSFLYNTNITLLFSDVLCCNMNLNILLLRKSVYYWYAEIYVLCTSGMCCK